MFRKISISVLAIVILTVLISSVSSKPVDSRDIFQRESRAGNFQRKSLTVGPFRRLFCLDESAISRLSKIADIVMAGRDGCRKEVRKILVPEKTTPEVEIKKDWKFSVRVPVEKLEFKPRKFHCDPIEDVFIPAVDKKVPAYICKLDGRQFIVSSERFREDFKDHLEIDVDETTFQRLDVDDGIGLEKNVAHVIPVTLTQRRGEEFYGVKGDRN